ncbi:MAG: xanthine dehydrogenase molybdopterin binding subunit [Parvularculaceae bacterium]
MPDAGRDMPAFAPIKGGVREAVRHDSAEKHVAGAARYIDDLPIPDDVLHVYVAMSARAHARLSKLGLERVRAASGVVCVLAAADIPGRNDYSPIAGDDPVFAENEVFYAGQPLFAVVAETLEAARVAAANAEVAHEDLEALTTIAKAREKDSVIERVPPMRLGDAKAALKNAPHRVSGRRTIGGQDHFYLEGQVALAIPMEDGDVQVFSSTQNPTEGQHVVARVLGKPFNAVAVEVRRMGGGFGGKETQPSLFAAIAALAATKTGRPAKVRLDRDDDMIMTGKRHDFEVAYEVGYDGEGRIEAADILLESRCGYSADLSSAINDRAMFHADNAYFLKNAHIESRRYRTHTVSNTAFRGFGGPQGMLAIECALDEIAFHLGADPLDIRLRNIYALPGRAMTPYGQSVEDCVARELMEALAEKADYRARREAIAAFNRENRILKKGISLTPVKFGISFTTTHLNQAGALVHVYTDGSVHLNHGGTEMGQGLMIKVAQVVAHEFQIDLDHVKISATATDKVPNTSATAASSGSDINGMAAREAARAIKSRLAAFAAEKYDCAVVDVAFRDNHVHAGAVRVPFRDLVKAAYLARISLSSTGFYRTPKIHYDKSAQKGRPFFYYAYGAAASEVVIDTLTGENRILRVDILHDVGRSLNPAVDMGQIEGGFIQGLGWLTTEELFYDEAGVLKTHAPSTYKIPACSDRPEIMNMEIWDEGVNRENTIHKSKAVGEPPLMLAISAFSALGWAVAAAGAGRAAPRLNAPATPEEILRAVEDVRRRAAEA